MCSPSPAVAVKTRNPHPTNNSCSLNPHATPFVNSACRRARDPAAGGTPSVAPPHELMTSPPPAVSMLPPLLPHQFLNRPSSLLPPPPVPPTFPHSSSAAPISVPTFPHHHYHYYYYQHQTALYTSFRPTYPHPAAAYHHVSAAVAGISSSPFSYSNQQLQYSHQNTHTHPPPNVVLSYTVQPEPKPTPEPKFKVTASVSKLPRRFTVGMMTARRNGVARGGGSHRPVRVSTPGWKIAGGKRVSSSSFLSGKKSAVAAASKDGATSLMIRNIPNHFQRFHLLQYLDTHCADENKKLLLAAAGEQKHVSPVSSSRDGVAASEYDFLYLPMDFRTGANLGYAFVNFTSAVAAARFEQSFSNYKWNSSASNSKICKITPAEIQGKDGLVSHFKNSKFRCKFDYYLPVVFSPPRDGLGQRKTMAAAAATTTSILIGQRIPPKVYHRGGGGGRRHLVRRDNNRLG
ncbi:unnamed protein product [Linum trigynum]|uniref:Mei2-like C-terminal RNA recognition motif domain-containing protein n=1 Tax=Linum trigynum TaxID=586398 RepID=A0AAV2D0T6_9ROSI